MTIDRAKIEHTEAVVALLREEHAAQGFGARVPFDPDSARFIVTSAIARPSEHVLLVAEDGGSVAGCICATVSGFYTNLGERLLAEMFTIVAPESRGNGVGSRLLDALEACAKELGVRHVVMQSQPHDAGGKAAEALYRKHGYAVAETTWIKGV
jgi:GNAT superfamily N-acetyltransferase